MEKDFFILHSGANTYLQDRYSVQYRKIMFVVARFLFFTSETLQYNIYISNILRHFIWVIKLISGLFSLNIKELAATPLIA